MNKSKEHSSETSLQKVSKSSNHTGFWLTLAGAVVGTAGYFYLTQTSSGREVVNRTKSKLDDYLANIENRLAAAEYSALHAQDL